jgi:hypothetical protein
VPVPQASIRSALQGSSRTPSEGPARSPPAFPGLAICGFVLTLVNIM